MRSTGRAACDHEVVLSHDPRREPCTTRWRDGPHRPGHAARHGSPTSSATSSMPTITDLTGPAGRLEAVLDLPAADGTDAAAVRAAVVFAHPHPQFGGTMHTKAVYQGAKGLARLGCAVLRFNFRGVGSSDGTFDQGDGEKEDFSAALDYMARDIPAAAVGRRVLVRLVGRAGGRRRSTIASRSLIGIAPPVATSMSGMKLRVPGHAREREAQVLRPGRGGRGVPDRGDVEVLRSAARAKGAGRHRRRRPSVRRARRRRSARRSRICWDGVLTMS